MRFLCCLVIGVAASGCAWYMKERSAYRRPAALEPIPELQVPADATAPPFGPGPALPEQDLPALPPHDSLKIPDPSTGEFQSRRRPARPAAPRKGDPIAEATPVSRRVERIVRDAGPPGHPALPAGYIELPPPP